jgi:hypothetical protein
MLGCSVLGDLAVYMGYFIGFLGAGNWAKG